MSLVETQAEADRLNETGTTEPYMAANGHRMIALLRFPKEPDGRERDYRIGDEIRYTTWNAWCAPDCHHDAPPPDW